MKIIQTKIILLLGLTIFSCDHSKQTRKEKTALIDTVSKTLLFEETGPEKAARLLNSAAISDSLKFNNQFEFDSIQSFLFFKSGKIISKTEKHALVVVCSTDTIYTIKLYSIKDKKSKLLDTIAGLEAFPWQFDSIFEDYNFDGQTDIFIQVSASNGWSLSRGHLIIIEQKTKKLNLHKEARDLANMTPDKKTKTVKTELWNGYDNRGRHHLTVFTNRWINGKLKMVSKNRIVIK